MKPTSTHTSCILCGNENLASLENYQDAGLVKCGNCGLVFCQNIPSKSELEAYYTENYDRTRYFSPITRIRYEELLDSFEVYRTTNRILDIGCGYGFFLEIAKEKGWEVYGTELSEVAVRDCEEKGITMFHGELQDSPFEEGMFDVIVSIEVLEHLYNPNDYISAANRMLRTGGIFYLTTPNFNAYLRYRLKEKYDVIEYPNHLAYYTTKTLNRLFTQNGFTTVKIETTGMSVTRLKTSRGVSNQEYVSETSDDEMLRYRIEQNRGLRFTKDIANSFLNLTKTGISLKGTFIKD